MTKFERVRLGDLADVLTISKGFPTQRASSEGEVPVMSIAALRNETPPKYFTDRVVMSDVRVKPAQPGDVLVSVEGGTVGETLVVRDDTGEFVPSQQVATLRVNNTNAIDPWYLGAWLATEPAQEQLGRLARGMAIQRIPIKDLTSLTVIVPPLVEQREISQRFLAFENAIHSHRSVTACLEQLRGLDLVVSFADTSPSSTSISSAKQRMAETE